MNRSDLLSIVCLRTGVSPSVARMVSDSIFSTIENSLLEGEPVLISGFGRFYTKERAERHGRNIQTGEQMNIPGGRIVRFKPGVNLRNLDGKSRTEPKK